MRAELPRTLLVGLPIAFAVAASSGACAGEQRSSFEETPLDGGPAGFDNDARLPDDLADVDAGSCLSETLAAEPLKLAMLLVMDRSGSMSGAKWDMARQAMIGFADTKGAAGSQLGLTLFPPDSNGGDDCLTTSYAPIVPIAPLPGNGVAIKTALLARDVGGGTPMTPALQGGADAMTSFLAQNPKHEGVIILVTDGDPGGCSSTVASVSAVAQASANGTPRIRTFVVGMEGAPFSKLDTIAAAGGGAPKAFNASGTASDAGTPQEQLLDALDKIRSAALGCEYVVPTPEASKGTVDPD